MKKQAKLVQQLVATGDDGGLGLLREFHPRFANASPESPPVGFKLADAQLVVARLYGLSSWPRLRAHIGLIEEFTGPDPADVDVTIEVDRFVSLACVSYHGFHNPLDRIELARNRFVSTLVLRRHRSPLSR